MKEKQSNWKEVWNAVEHEQRRYQSLLIRLWCMQSHLKFWYKPMTGTSENFSSLPKDGAQISMNCQWAVCTKVRPEKFYNAESCFHGKIVLPLKHKECKKTFIKVESFQRKRPWWDIIVWFVPATVPWNVCDAWYLWKPYRNMRKTIRNPETCNFCNRMYHLQCR